MSIEPAAVASASTRDVGRAESVDTAPSHAATLPGPKRSSPHLTSAGNAPPITDRAAPATDDTTLRTRADEPQVGAPDAESELSPYQPASADELLPPPDFRPFFTLIEDHETAVHHHPTVHYVFSDDDPDILTSAILDALDTHVDASARSELRPGEAEQRYVILDLAPDGKTVTTASSLNPQWQAIKTRISQAPSWGDGSQGADHRLMLSISGQEMEDAGTGNRRRRVKASGLGLDELVSRFGQRLDDFDLVLDRLGPEEVGNRTTTQ